MLAVALVREWGAPIVRRLVGWSAVLGSVVLTLYGGVFVVTGALVLGGAITTSEPIDEHALRWHVFLWDLWFLVWGVMLGLAAWGHRRTQADRR
jgi:hypothetical protein